MGESEKSPRKRKRRKRKTVLKLTQDFQESYEKIIVKELGKRNHNLGKREEKGGNDCLLKTQNFAKRIREEV